MTKHIIDIVIYDTISASSTIERKHGNLKCRCFNYYEDRKDLVSEANEV